MAPQQGRRSDDFVVLAPAGSNAGAPSRPRHPEVILRASRDREESAIQGPDRLDRFASDLGGDEGGVGGWTRAGPSSFHRVSARRRPATVTTRWVCIAGGSAARERWGAAQETLLEGCGGPAGGALQKGRSRTISPCSCRPARILARPRACGIARQPYVLAAAARRAWVKVRIDSVTSPQVGPLRGG